MGRSGVVRGGPAFSLLLQHTFIPLECSRALIIL